MRIGSSTQLALSLLSVKVITMQDTVKPQSRAESAGKEIISLLGGWGVREIRKSGRRACAKNIASMPIGISEVEAIELVASEERKLISSVGGELSNSEEAILLIRFYRGVNECIGGFIAKKLALIGSSKAELLCGGIDYSPEADYE